jgi:hypothetical protein
MTDRTMRTSGQVGLGTAPPLIEANDATTYSYSWLHDLLRRATGLDLDEPQVTAAARLAERKLLDLFDVAKEAALANGRERILRHDLPLTKGLRRALLDVEIHAKGIGGDRVLRFLVGAGVPGPIDEMVQAELPRLTAALLILTGRVIDILEPAGMDPMERLDLLTRRDRARPTEWELGRAARVLDLTL